MSCLTRAWALRATLILALALSLPAAPLQVVVSGLASDVVYLGAGASEGLAVGMKGELQATDGRIAQFEILYVSSGKASCRVSPAGAEVRVGDQVLFASVTPPAKDSLAVTAVVKELPPAALAAIERAEAQQGPRLSGWWRLDGTHSLQDAEASSQSRQSVGLRLGLARRQDLALSLQARNRSTWNPALEQEAWLDELSLTGTAGQGSLAWEAGRMADGRGALPGPVDGLALESPAGKGWNWGLSAGSRPAATDQMGRRATGAGGRIRWQPAKGPLASDLKLRWERNGAGDAMAGASWSNQLRFLEKGRLEQWLRAEFSDSNNWKHSLSRFSSTRLRWVGEGWQVAGRHQLNTMPVQVPEGLQSGPAVEDRRSHLLELDASRQWGGTWLSLRLLGRGDQLDGNLERSVELMGSRSTDRRLLSRIHVSLLGHLGPEIKGQDLDLRLLGTPAPLPELELGLRGWRLDQHALVLTGWNGSLYARGRFWKGLRWEAGGLLQREDGLWVRELRAGLRGDLSLRFARSGGSS